MVRRISLLLPALAGLFWSGCAQVEPPARVTRPVPVSVDLDARVDQALAEFFAELDRKSTTLNRPES